jgi:hypothetical protein
MNAMFSAISQRSKDLGVLRILKELARVLLGEKGPVLHPFRHARFGEGVLPPVSSISFPWS